MFTTRTYAQDVSKKTRNLNIGDLDEDNLYMYAVSGQERRRCFRHDRHENRGEHEGGPGNSDQQRDDNPSEDSRNEDRDGSSLQSHAPARRLEGFLIALKEV